MLSVAAFNLLCFSYCSSVRYQFWYIVLPEYIYMSQMLQHQHSLSVSVQ